MPPVAVASPPAQCLFAVCLLLALLLTGHPVSSLSVPLNPDVIRSYALFECPADSNDGQRGECVGRCQEVRAPPKAADDEEDEVELWYPTSLRSFLFPKSVSSAIDRPAIAAAAAAVQVTVRQTSFGCGRLGATVWPSGIALACQLASGEASRRQNGGLEVDVTGRRVLELGAGCGVPIVVARDACGASAVLATDFWEEEGGDFDGDRLVPKNLFGVNLKHNVGGGDESSVRKLDWHDKLGVIYIADQFKPDIVIGSDLVYYPMDTAPLFQTLDVLMRSGAEKIILFCPLPPLAEREALPEFRTRLERGDLENCRVDMDELEMDIDDGTERHRSRILRIVISNVKER